MALSDDLPSDETRELLQALIRNRCVNDGSPTSGDEHRNAAVLEAYLLGRGVELQRYEPVPGRVSLLARLQGTDPDAPTIGLMGHTDVVPVTPERWQHDPFGAELIDGEVWGRGAIDMLNLTASMAVAMRRLAEGPRPRASVLFLATADEEGGGELGASWLAEHHWDDVACDVVLTEAGGILTHTAGGPRIAISNAEKGVAWRDVVVRGTSSHGSRPYLADNALVTAAEVVRRLTSHRAGAQIGEEWEAWVRMQGLDADHEAALLDPARVLDTIDSWEHGGDRALMHAMTHTTFSPNVIRGGSKTNVIPDEVHIRLDVRTLPGATDEDVEAHGAQGGDEAGEVQGLGPHLVPSEGGFVTDALLASVRDHVADRQPLVGPARIARAGGAPGGPARAAHGRRRHRRGALPPAGRRCLRRRPSGGALPPGQLPGDGTCG